MKKTDGREVDEQKKHDDERSTIKADKDKQNADKDMEHEICVSSWNIDWSSARYDFLREVAQCQVDVAMFQETVNLGLKTVRLLRSDGAYPQVEKERKGGNCRKKEELRISSKHARSSARWAIIVLESIFFLSLYLPHT